MSFARNPLENIRIKRASSTEDYRDAEKVQLKAWGMREAELVPLHILRPINEKGGLVLNAYDDEGRAIGTTIGFLGNHNEKLIFYSHMTGVIPKFQGKGVGRALKLKQRQFALARGLDLICWTYDPMQSQNNWFNLSKLGAISRIYYVNYYGEMPDRLNRGLATDRFLAEWWIRSPRVRTALASQGKPPHETVSESAILNQTFIKDEMRAPSGRTSNPVSRVAFIEIPSSYDRARDVNSSILQKWREDTRKVYTSCFKSGFIATRAIVHDSNKPRSFVKIERRSLRWILNR